MHCYLLGSLAGGTGSECSHTISKKNITKFLKSLKIENLQELKAELSNYMVDDWRRLHHKVIDHQTDSFIWSETDWSDD